MNKELEDHFFNENVFENERPPYTPEQRAVLGSKAPEMLELLKEILRKLYEEHGALAVHSPIFEMVEEVYEVIVKELREV